MAHKAKGRKLQRALPSAGSKGNRRDEIQVQLSYLSWLKVQNEYETKDLMQKTHEQMTADQQKLEQTALRKQREKSQLIQEEETKPLVLTKELAQHIREERSKARTAFRKRHKEVMEQFKSLEEAQRQQLVHRQRLARYRSIKAEIKTLRPPEQIPPGPTEQD